MVTNDVADGLVAENARLRARLEEALANAQVWGERMLQAQNERDHAKRELAAARSAIEGKAIVEMPHLAEILVYVFGGDDVAVVSAEARDGLLADLRAALDAPQHPEHTGQRRENTTAGTL